VALLRMRFLPDPILRRQAKKIGKVLPRMKKFTDDMIETMRAEQGVGLAANQVGSLQKVVVIQLPDWEDALVLINPEITRQEGEREVEEGCLSIPGYRGTVKRSMSVRARAIGLDGQVIRIKADGLLAQALEHETGHVNGSLYIDHLISPDSLWKVTQSFEDDEEDEKDSDTPNGESDDAAGPSPEEADRPGD